MRCCPRATRPISTNLRPESASASRRRRPAHRSFPNILSAVVPSVTLVNLHDDGSATCRTPIRGRRASKSSSSSATHGTVSVGYQHLRGPAPDHVDQSERADLRGVGHQQRLPAEPELRQQQPVLVAGGLQLPRPARVLRAAAGASGAAIASPTRYSKSLNNVGEFFFSSPIDPFNIWQGLGPIRRRSAAPRSCSTAPSTRRRAGQHGVADASATAFR